MGMRILMIHAMECVLLDDVDNARIEVGLVVDNSWQTDCSSNISSSRDIEISQRPWRIVCSFIIKELIPDGWIIDGWINSVVVHCTLFWVCLASVVGLYGPYESCTGRTER